MTFENLESVILSSLYYTKFMQSDFRIRKCTHLRAGKQKFAFCELGFSLYKSLNVQQAMANRGLLSSGHAVFSLRKTVGKVSTILVTLTSRSDSNFERSNISLKETKPDGVDSSSNGLNYCVRNNEGKIRWFSADCIVFTLERKVSRHERTCILMMADNFSRIPL